MKTKIYLTIIITTIWFSALSQTVTGSVFEHSVNGHNPLPGTTVLQLNTTNGTITDEEGHFMLKLEH